MFRIHTSKFFFIPSLLCVVLTGCWFQSSRTPPSASTRKSTGSLGKYKFASPAEVKVFNAKIIEWLSQRGYAPCTNISFFAIVGSDEWKMPGQLLCHPYNPANQAWVFIPECYRAEDNIQIIGYHITLQGELEDVNKHQSDFSSTKMEFQKCFPSSWEQTTTSAEPDGPANGSKPIGSEPNQTSSAVGSHRWRMWQTNDFRHLPGLE
jgi:hypothetical protein